MKEHARVPGSPHTRVATALLLTFVVLLLASCEGVGRDPGPQDDIGEPTPEQQEQATTPSESYANLERLTRRPRIFYDEKVAVDGRIGRTISPNAFSLTGEKAAQSGEAFEAEAALVAGDSGTIPDLSEGQRVRVTGEVRELNIEKLERELGIDLKNGLYREYEERPVIVAGTVKTLADGETTGG